MAFEIDSNIEFEVMDIECPKFFDPKKLTNWINKVGQRYNKKVGDLTYIFCGDDKILEVNQQFLQHDYYTDIITFDYSEEDYISGDLFISLDTVASNAEEFNVSFEEEFHRVIIHGVLHLCGLKDKSKEDAKCMRTAENEALVLLHL